MNNRISVFIVITLVLGMMVISNLDVPYTLKKIYFSIEIIAVFATAIEYLYRKRNKHNKSTT
jgi:hypothetical protein